MRSPKKSATCIRKPDGGLVMESKDLKNGASWLKEDSPYKGSIFDELYDYGGVKAPKLFGRILYCRRGGDRL